MLTIQHFILFPLFFPLVFSFLDIVLDRFELIEQDINVVDWTGVRVRKYNKTTRGLIGETKLLVPHGNDFTVEVKVYKKQGNRFFAQFNLNF